jgi:non-ribosomal peptide synthase protein (TIGR01720 family)
VDHLSWEILLQDLSLAYDQLRCGRQAQLPARTTSFKAWSEALGELAAAPVARTHLAGWLGGLGGGSQSLPARSRLGPGSPRMRWLEFEPAETAWLEEAGSASGIEAHEMLLAALGGALASWAGFDRTLVELEHHGRVDVVPEVDLSRTVGWFACAYPVLVETDMASAPHVRLRQLRERLRSIPDGGIWYGLLRHRCPDGEVRDRLAALGSPEIGFVLLRQPGGDAGQVFAANAWGLLERQTGRRSLQVDAVLGGGRLRVGFAYHSAVLDEAWVEGLTAAFGAELRALIANVGAAGPHPTPADFPEAGLTQEDLDHLLAGLGAEWSEEKE